MAMDSLRIFTGFPALSYGTTAPKVDIETATDAKKERPDPARSGVTAHGGPSRAFAV
jgi:hypothetical protein